MFMKVFFLCAASLLPFAVNAIPHTDCTQQFKISFNSDHVKKLDLRQALEIADTEGLLQNQELRSAQLNLERAEQIYAVYLNVNGGSATDLVTADRDCTVREVIRVQEE